MEEAYAQALWKMVEEGMTPSKAVHALQALLQRHGRLALLPRIGKAFARIAERELQKEAMTLTVAREADARGAKAAAKEVLAKMKMDAKEVDIKVDDSLIGGWRLEGKETLLDKSYKTRLLELFTRAVSA